MPKFLFLILFLLNSTLFAEEYRSRHVGNNIFGLGEIKSSCNEEEQNFSEVIDELSIPSTNDSYFEYNIESALYYNAEMIDIFYDDGTKLRIGIIDPWTKRFEPKIENVDCKTSTHDLIKLEIPGTGYRFINRSVLREIADHPQEDIIKYSTKVEFTQDLKSGKIVPSHINNLTAPHICKMLRDTEEEFVEEWDAFAKGMVKYLEKKKMIVELMLWNPGGSTISSITRLRPLRGAPKKLLRPKTGMTNKAAEFALSGMNKSGGHAMRRAINNYGLIPNVGNHATKFAKFKKIFTPFLTSPYGKPFRWTGKDNLGKVSALGYLRKIPVQGKEQWLMIQVALEGPFAGKVISLIKPKPNQLKTMFKRMGIKGS